MTNDILKKVYDTYKQDIPRDSNTFFATTATPVSKAVIRKYFKTFETFVKEYNVYCVKQRNLEKPPVVTKKETGDGIKK